MIVYQWQLWTLKTLIQNETNLIWSQGGQYINRLTKNYMK